MPKTKISEFSATPGNNTDIDGINIAEGCAPSGINDAIRELMAQLKDFQAGTAGDSFNGPVGTSTAAAGAFTTLTTSSTVTHNGGTANGVAYLNGSKVLTTGSALTFDGTNFKTTGSVLAGGAVPSSGAGVTLAYNGSTIGYIYAYDWGASTYKTLNVAGGTVDISAANNTQVSFGVNGSEQARLTSTGLGIGTSSPGYPLQVRRAGGAGSLGITVDSVGSINRVTQYYSIGDTTAVTTGHAWYTRNASATDNLSLLLDNSGNLGIGTSSPAKTLHVSSGSYTYPARIQSTGGTTTGIELVNTGSSANPPTIGSKSDALFFETSNTERARIDSSGNLGLGVTPSGWGSTAKAFTVKSTGSAIEGSIANSGATNAISFVNNGYYNAGWKYVYSGGSFAAGRYDIEGGEHRWYTAPSGTAGNAISFTQAMTLTSAGLLGVGVTAPEQRIHLPNNTGIRLGDAGATPKADITYSSAGSEFLDIKVQGTITGYGNIRFYTGGTPDERARITSGGHFKASNSGTYIGSAGVYHELVSSNGDYIVQTRNSASSSAYGIRVNYSGSAPNGTGNEFLVCDDTNALRATIRSNGGLANYSANDVNLSDRREKTNLAPAKSYLDTICAIPVQTFNYIDQSEDDPGLTLGVVAQDVQAVAPELVMESNWGTEDNPKMRLSIYQTDLQYALMKALQELKAEFDAYKATHP